MYLAFENQSAAFAWDFIAFWVACTLNSFISLFIILLFIFVDLIFGMPSLQPRDFESRLHEERSRYLVAELLCAVFRNQLIGKARKNNN